MWRELARPATPCASLVYDGTTTIFERVAAGVRAEHKRPSLWLRFVVLKYHQPPQGTEIPRVRDHLCHGETRCWISGPGMAWAVAYIYSTVQYLEYRQTCCAPLPSGQILATLGLDNPWRELCQKCGEEKGTFSRRLRGRESVGAWEGGGGVYQVARAASCRT